MSANDGFRDAVDALLLRHREDRPYNPADLSKLCDCRRSFSKWRKHTVELITAARAEADRRRIPRTAVDILAAHAPYARTGYAIQCNECLDTTGRGEFATIEDWASHLGNELGRAGYRVVRAQ
jgi:hypothetical protein